MPRFSNRRGVPTRRRDGATRPRGRRPGSMPTCRARLRGWLRNVCRRSPIWGDVDIGAFCRKTGYSREHATRELSSIRRNEPEFAFETKQRRKSKRGRKRWGVIVASPDKLRFDRHSLFFDRSGKPLHNYTALTDDGEKLPPTIPTRPPNVAAPVSGGTPVLVPVLEQAVPRVCDNANIRKDYSVIQQTDLYGAKRDVALSREMIKRSKPKPIPKPLRRKAFALQPLLLALHWDNCKVAFSRRASFCYALRALLNGHEQERIVASYDRALFVCHGFAVDQAASTGKLVAFNASSTIKKARELLAKDGLGRAERVTNWYKKHAESPLPEPDPAELAEMRAQIAATFPRDEDGTTKKAHSQTP